MSTQTPGVRFYKLKKRRGFRRTSDIQKSRATDVVRLWVIVSDGSLLGKLTPVFECAYFAVNVSAELLGHVVAHFSCRGTHKHALFQLAAKGCALLSLENYDLLGEKKIEIGRIIDTGCDMYEWRHIRVIIW